MVPLVAIIGRQNVGKSTLFNRLTNTNTALVGTFPGLTRDRKYGHVKIENYEFICIDTGGIDLVEDKGIKSHITKQSLLAIKESDLVLFVLDKCTGLMPADYAIADYLRSNEKKVFIVVNKIDNADIDQAIVDFWSLGFNKIYPISASYGHGVSNLLEAILLLLTNKINLLEEKIKEDSFFNLSDLPIKIAIIGRPNVGKSTLANRILGKNRMIVYDRPGTTSDSIYIPIEHRKHKYILIDTAGIRKKTKIRNLIEELSVIQSIKAIKDANVVLIVINAIEGPSDQDLSLIGYILDNGKALVIIVNKWDILSKKNKKKLKEILKYRLKFINLVRVKLHFLSALNSNNESINNLFKSINEAYNNSVRYLSAAILTYTMNQAVKNHQPPLLNGRKIRFKYAHVGGYNPPVIIIHGNHVKHIIESYKRYLIKYFIKSLNINGTPIHIKFKEGENPYGNKNTK